MEWIPASWLFARQALAGRRRRTALLATAVAMACALVTALSTGMATLRDNITRRMERLVGDAQVRIVHTTGESFGDALVADVLGWAGVAEAAGLVEGSLLLTPLRELAPGEEELPRVTVQARGRDLDPARDANRFDLRSGRLPTADDEVLLDPMAAELLGVSAGDRLEVQRFGEPLTLQVVGIYERPVIGALQRPIARLSRAGLITAADLEPGVTQVLLTLRDDVDPTAWLAANGGRVGASLRIEPAEAMISGLDRPRRALTIALSIVSVMAFLCCAFIVATGLTSAMAEQVREIAVVRALGASRAQVVGGQLAIGLCVGSAGAALGVPLGLGLAWWVASHYSHWLPLGLIVPWWSPVLAIGGGVGAGLMGAAYPAVRAAAVPPLEAMRVRSKAPSMRGLLLTALIGVALVACAIGPFAAAQEESWRFWLWAFVGLPLIFVAWFLLSVPVLWMLAVPVGATSEVLLRLPSGLLLGSLRASPYRFGMTAGAMMVGVAVLTITQTNGPAMLDNLAERVRFADAFICKTTGLSTAEQARLRTIPALRDAVPVGYLPLRVQGYRKSDGTTGSHVLGIADVSPPNVVAIGFPPEEFFALNRIEWERGDPVSALAPLREGRGILVAREFLTSRGLDLGDTVDIGPMGRSKTYEIVGVVSAAGLDVATQFFGIRSVYSEHAVSCVFLDFDEVGRQFGSREAYIMQVNLDEGLTDADEVALGTLVQSQAPGTLFISGRKLRGFVLELGETIMSIFVGIGEMAIVLATLGTASVVAAGLNARAMEWGVLRAIGGHPSLVTRLAVGEGMAVALTALVSGVALGLQLAWAERQLFSDLAGLELVTAMPWSGIAIAAMTLLALCTVTALIVSHRTASRPSRELLQDARGS
ncbi:MAG: ABC transporter permease [Planctomycetota bacterium]|nr:ABC transporter permease [Planctomycetota bacterium]MDA1104976.1 ABC transporter permease [Planctomycetota bacterium]